MIGERPRSVSRIARMTLPLCAWVRYVRRRLPLLLRKQRSDVRKRLDFERIARRVQEEHGRLFANFTLEAHMRLDDEFHPGRGEFVRCRLPLIHRQHHAEVPDRDGIAVYLARLPMTDFVRREMGHDLVPVEIEVHPVGRAAAFRATEQVAIKLTGGRNVMDRKGEMKRGNGSSGVAHGRLGYRLSDTYSTTRTRCARNAVMVREKWRSRHGKTV